ncbi:unnamed protein product [Prunus armeniaca]|uniref:Uncharacterized protein n=1 Tax=Prunus armeniaca TaxID=36596 RepID=A0A6J5TKX3_PRUAR|nr:hypothetical protein GBA52_003198 [Prunus armeniaca]CAB4264309.1 unnamed protein product [Prunus armeniaca]CAB4294932.1 unnamed protein product [Prunus armeniaca]
MDRIKITSDVPGKKIYASCNNTIGTSIGTIVPKVPCLKARVEPTTYSPATPPQALPLPPTPLPCPPLPVTPPPSPPMPSMPPPSLPMPVAPPLALILPATPLPAPHLPDTPPPSPPVLAMPPLALILPPTPPPLTATSSPFLPMPATPLPILPLLAPPLPNRPQPTLPLPTTPPLAPPLPNRPQPTLPLPTMPSPAPPLPFTLASLVPTPPPPALPATPQMSFKGNKECQICTSHLVHPELLNYIRSTIFDGSEGGFALPEVIGKPPSSTITNPSSHSVRFILARCHHHLVCTILLEKDTGPRKAGTVHTSAETVTKEQ